MFVMPNLSQTFGDNLGWSLSPSPIHSICERSLSPPHIKSICERIVLLISNLLFYRVIYYFLFNKHQQVYNSFFSHDALTVLNGIYI